MGGRVKGLQLREPGLIDFWGEKLLLPGQWSSALYLEPGIERNLAVRCSQSAGNLKDESRFQCCWLGWSQGCPGSTRSGYIIDEISHANRVVHYGRDYGTGYNLGCGDMTASWGTGWSDIFCIWACHSWDIWHAWGFLHLWGFYHLIEECCGMVTVLLCLHRAV